MMRKFSMQGRTKLKRLQTELSEASKPMWGTECQESINSSTVTSIVQAGRWGQCGGATENQRTTCKMFKGVNFQVLPQPWNVPAVSPSPWGLRPTKVTLKKVWPRGHKEQRQRWRHHLEREDWVERVHSEQRDSEPVILLGSYSSGHIGDEKNFLKKLTSPRKGIYSYSNYGKREFLKERVTP